MAANKQPLSWVQGIDLDVDLSLTISIYGNIG